MFVPSVDITRYPTEEDVVTIFGLVVTADDALLKYEARHRSEINALRKEARIDLARRGIVPTETALRRWQAEREKVKPPTEDEPGV
jgi:hypothetical protein